MTSIRHFMTDDHRRCDDFFAAVEQAVAQGKLPAGLAAFEHFSAAVLAHFDAEEKTLFPAFERATGMMGGPTQVMRMEHAQMRDLMATAVDALRAGEAEDYLGQAETLLIMMQQHNMKEENILYPMCDQHLAPDLAALVDELEKELAVA